MGNTTIDWTELPNADKITEIRGAAFSGCTNLAITEIPRGVTTINSQTFYECTSLETINLPEVTRINSWNNVRTFGHCTNLRKVVAPKLQILDGYTFVACTSLEEVQLGSIGHPMTSIGTNAFMTCLQGNLTIKVYIADGETSLSGAPWGATNATIEYYNATTGTKIN